MPELRSDLQALLDLWASGVMDEAGVRDEAEWVCEQVPWDDLGTDELAPEREVCDQLELMHIQLATKADIPEMQMLLAAVDGTEAQARERWDTYWDAIDYRERAASLLDSVFYTAGAESVLKTFDVPSAWNRMSRWIHRIF